QQALGRRYQAEGEADLSAATAGWLLPEGCRTIDDAAYRVILGLTSQDGMALDQSIQSAIESGFGRLSQLCQPASGAATQLAHIAARACGRYLAPRIDTTSASEAFLGAFAGPEGGGAALAAAEAAARPILADPELDSQTILELPAAGASE